MKLPLSFSILFHILLVTLGLLIPYTQKDTHIYPNIKLLTPKQFDDLTQQIVKTSKSKNQKDSKNPAYLSDKTNKTDQKQIARGSVGNKSTSIHQKGSSKPEEKKGKGVSASDDYIEGATIGPMTILNTQEFKYFNYYERIKGKVTEIWRPMIRKEIVKLNIGKKLMLGIHTTKLLITLNEHGEVLTVGIVKSSGINAFDQVGIKTFMEIRGFSGPPAELVKDGKFELRWDFLVVVQESGLIEFRGNYGS